MWRNQTVRTYYKLALALLAGVGIGAAAVQGLHAQAKPIAYTVSEIDVTNPEAFTKEYLPVARKALGENGAGYKIVASGGKTVSIEGAAPKGRVVINSFENLEAAVAAYNSPTYKEARKIGDKYATWRIFATEAAQ
jgi:uncharacterized protein (DUF1330 family)